MAEFLGNQLRPLNLFLVHNQVQEGYLEQSQLRVQGQEACSELNLPKVHLEACSVSLPKELLLEDYSANQQIKMQRKKKNQNQCSDNNNHPQADFLEEQILVALESLKKAVEVSLEVLPLNQSPLKLTRIKSLQAEVFLVQVGHSLLQVEVSLEIHKQSQLLVRCSEAIQSLAKVVCLVLNLSQRKRKKNKRSLNNHQVICSEVVLSLLLLVEAYLVLLNLNQMRKKKNQNPCLEDHQIQEEVVYLVLLKINLVHLVQHLLLKQGCDV